MATDNYVGADAGVLSLLLLVEDAANLDIVIALFKFKEMPLNRLVVILNRRFFKVFPGTNRYTLT